MARQCLNNIETNIRNLTTQALAEEYGFNFEEAIEFLNNKIRIETDYYNKFYNTKMAMTKEEHYGENQDNNDISLTPKLPNIDNSKHQPESTKVKKEPELNNVLEPCNIKELDLDIERLRECLKRDYFTDGRMEYIKTTATNNLILDDGFMEYITAKCINGIRVGEGHCPIDITKDNKGIDILCVCLNGTMTNEKSIMQNFSNCGNNLDNLFENGKYQEALSLFIKEYHIKLLNAKETKNINNLYYCAYISTDINVYISVFKINLECISNIKYENITKQKKSIKFKGFIHDKYGFTTLFKSKKRLEIRLNKEILNCYNTIKLI